jgi:RimJ/RimL family protein N-acetyltransferase
MFTLRSVTEADTPFILSLRRDHNGRAEFLGRGSLDPANQAAWITAQRKRPGDYYFVIERKATDEPEGLIGLYNIKGRRAEWGRWISTAGSLCAVESLLILLRFAFQTESLREVYSRTVADNLSVVSFHESIGARRRISRVRKSVTLGDKDFEQIEHVITKELFLRETQAKLTRLSGRLSQKNGQHGD